MKALSFMILFIIFIPVNTLSLGVVPVQQEESKGTVKTTTTPSSAKPFKTSFISLTRGHAIAPSFLTFGDEKQFEIQTPGEDFLQAKGTYTKNTMLFNAHFEATLLKQKKHYQYTFTIKGISLFDNYIAGPEIVSFYQDGKCCLALPTHNVQFRDRCDMCGRSRVSTKNRICDRCHDRISEVDG